MDTNTWIWVALVAFLVFCCGSMFFMGRHGRQSSSKQTPEERVQSSERRE